MDVEIRPVTAEEFETWARAIERAFGSYARDDELAAQRRIFEPELSLAAFEGTDIVATTGAYSLVLTVPGGRVPMPGVTAVGVAPTHRRRGLLTMLMRRELDDFRERGQVLAGLWASEGSIYGRFGYGLATYAAEFKIESDRAAFLRPHEQHGRVVLLEKKVALERFPPIYERVAGGQPGMWQRTEAWWDHVTVDLEHWRDGATALFFAMHESPDGRADGYLIYRVKHDWDEGVPGSVLKVREFMAENPRAYADLWRYCFDHDLMKFVEAWPRPSDEPLLHMLAEPRRLHLKVGDGLWLRLVDVPGALATRRYAVDGSVVLEVRDPFCPWNEGRYELEGGPHGAECRRSDRASDVILDAADLGAAYLGGVRFQTLARAGRVIEGSPGGPARADAMFAWDPLPYCSTVF
jgi:predicted acetyltransferase